MKLLNRPASVDDASATLAAAQGALQRWDTELADKARAADVAAAAVAEAEARAGTEALDEPDAVDRLTGELIRVRTAQEVAHRAVLAARERVATSRRDVVAAQGAELRRRAEALRAVCDRRQERTDRLLSEINSHERTTYRVHTGRVVLGDVASPPPLTLRMRDEVAHLEALAAEREQVAGSGGDDQVAALAARPVPDPRPIEAEGPSL